MQCVAVCCSVLQLLQCRICAAYDSSICVAVAMSLNIGVCGSVWQCVAVRHMTMNMCCSGGVAKHRRVLQYVAVCCSVWQWVAVQLMTHEYVLQWRRR